jgi:hypothetical protein
MEASLPNRVCSTRWISLSFEPMHAGPFRILAVRCTSLFLAVGTDYDIPYPTTSCTIPLRARSSKNLSMPYFLLLLNHIDICKFNSLIQYLEIIIKLSSNNEIYRNLAGGLVWRPERNGKEFDHLFAFCNCSSSVIAIVSPLVLFECSMTVESSRDVNLIANG